MFESKIEITDLSKIIDINDYKQIIISKEFLDYIQERDSEVYNSWYQKDNKYYYYKIIDYVNAFLNELIGEEVSKYMGLPTIEYQIVGNKYELTGLLSENFKDPSLVYKRSLYLTEKEHEYLNSVLLGINIDYKNDFRKLLTFYLYSNFYLSLDDRPWNSLAIINQDGSIDIGPIHDYESICYRKDKLQYNDPLISWDFNDYSINYLNPYVKEAIYKIENLELLKIIGLIEEKYQIEIPGDYKKEYLDFEIYRKKFLKSKGVLK